MKRIAVFALASLFATVGSARPITVCEAGKAVAAARDGFGLVCPAGPVVPLVVNGNTVCYHSRCGDKTVVVSAETSMPPILAVVDGQIDGSSVPETFSVIFSDALSAHSCIESERDASSKVLKTSGQRAGSVTHRNESDWRKLLGHTSPSARSLSSSFSDESSEEDYLIPGYETNGRYTHWTQTVSRDLDDKLVPFSGGYGNAGYVAPPLYNCYLIWHNSLGLPNSLGFSTLPPYSITTSFSSLWSLDVLQDGTKRISSIVNPRRTATIFSEGYRPRNLYPCGCSATAYASMFQCIGVTGCVDFANSCYIPRNPPVKQPYIWYDDFRMATNYVSSLGPSFVPDDPPSAGDLSGYQETLNSIPGTYDWDKLPWSFGGMAKTNQLYGIEKFHRDIAELGYHDGAFNDIDVDGEIMTSGARELCGRVTYNLGVALGLKYRSDVTTGITSNLVNKLKSAKNMFPGLGDYGYISSSWNGPVAAKAIRAGNPVAVSLRDNNLGNHAVLAVGRKKVLGRNFTRLFFGFGGSGDSWYDMDDLMDIIVESYEFTSSRGMYIIGGYGGAAVPVHGKVVSSDGDPVAGVQVVLRNQRDSLVTDLKTGDDGYFRGWVKVSTKGPSASSSDSFTYVVECNGETASFSANSYLLGDGPVGNPRYSDIDTWSSQFPSQNVTFVVSASDRNGYAYGTPASFDDVMSNAVRTLRVVGVVSGTPGTRSFADGFVGRLPESYRSRFVFYFLSGQSDTWFSSKGPGYSVMFVDPRTFDRSGLWTVENGVIGYGSFDNDDDFTALANRSWNAYDKAYLWSDHL